jgi:hypothetical protein
VDGAHLAWDQLDAVTIEPLHHLKDCAPHLILWPADGVDLGNKPLYTSKDGSRRGIQLLEPGQLKEGADALADALRAYAGGKLEVAS